MTSVHPAARTSPHSAARTSPPPGRSTPRIPGGGSSRPSAASRPALDQGAPGERLQRLRVRRRLAREELLAVAVLVLALAITLFVLGLQWLAGSPAATGSAPAAGSTFGGIV